MHAAQTAREQLSCRLSQPPELENHLGLLYKVNRMVSTLLLLSFTVHLSRRQATSVGPRLVLQANAHLGALGQSLTAPA